MPKRTSPKTPRTSRQRLECSGLPALSPPAPAHVSDLLLADIDVIINASIRELVFAYHHLEEDNLDDAQNCLTTVGMNIDRVQEQIVEAEKKAAARQAP